MTREPSDKEFLAWMEEGWIAGYPPWFYHFLVQPSDCKTEEETSRLLHLLRSIEDGKPDETRRLLEGMNPNLRLAVDDRQTESLFEWAAEKAAHNDCVRALLAAGASIRVPNLVWKLVSYRKQKLLEEVLRAGADPNSGPTEEGPLITACWGNARAARLLLDAGARMDVTTTVHVTNKRGIKGVTPLMVAAYAGEERIVKLLLERGVNAWAVDADGSTALHWARISRAKAKAARIIPLLEQAGALPVEDSGGLPEPVDFSRRARTSHFREALQAAKFLTGSPARSVEVMDEPLSGANAFRIRDPESALNLLEETRAKAAPLGALAFLSDIS